MEAPRRPVRDSAIEAVDDELATVCLQVRVSCTHVHVQKLPSVLVCPTRLTTSVLGTGAHMLSVSERQRAGASVMLLEAVAAPHGDGRTLAQRLDPRVRRCESALHSATTSAIFAVSSAAI